MIDRKLKYVYGPVESWRLGKSLGIDPLSDSKKICNMDCIYCQLGRSSDLVNERKDFVSTETIVSEVAEFFEQYEGTPYAEHIDHLTFSGRGEPTLALNLGDMIRGVRKFRKEKVAVITNATFLNQKSLCEDLSSVESMVIKLDGFDEKSFHAIDLPAEGTNFHKILEGIKRFRKIYKGHMAVQIMFLDSNKQFAAQFAECIKPIGADEIQLNTPLRPSGVKPLVENDMAGIKAYFEGLPAVHVYEREKRSTIPFDVKETVKRHGNYRVSQK